MLNTIIIILSCCGGGLLLFLIGYRFYYLLSWRFKPERKQIVELINQCTLVLANHQQLDFYEQIKPQSKRIFILISDFLGTANDFDEFVGKNNDQDTTFIRLKNNLTRDPDGYPRSGQLLYYLQQIFAWIENELSNPKLYLVLSGFSCGLFPALSKIVPNDTQIIFVNPITNWRRVRISKIVRIVMVIGFFSTWEMVLPVHIDYDTLTTNKKYSEQLTNRNITYRLRPLLNYLRLNRNFKHIIKACHDRSLLVVQGEASPFRNNKKWVKISQIINEYGKLVIVPGLQIGVKFKIDE